MTNLKLLDLIPNGIIVLKNKKIEFINKHILNILNIEFLGIDDAIVILLKTMNLKNETEFISFLTSNTYFIHKSKVVQISHNSYGDHDFFSFILINKDLISIDTINKNMKKTKNINIDEKVAKHLNLNNIKQVQVSTSYKGLPLKNVGTIKSINKEYIEIEADIKHSISLRQRDDILLTTNSKKGTTILHGHIFESEGTLFKIKNFVLSRDGMHLREGIRIKVFDDIKIRVDENEYIVHDISERGISIDINDEAQETFLKKTSSMKIIINDKSLPLDSKYLKTIYKDDKILKIIFLIFTSGKTTSAIHSYLNTKQNEIIREIHEYCKQFS